MENFVKVSANFVNGELANTLIGRSLVLVNTKTGAIFNVAAKCRNTDRISVAKALAKAVLAALRVANSLNSTEAATTAKKRVSNPMAQALSAHEVYVTDKDGKVLSDSGIKLVDKSETLRSVFRFTKSQPIYKLVVEQGKDWSDPAVSVALTWWATAAIEQLNPGAKFDEAFQDAADSTEAEAEAAEKAAKKAEEETKKQKQAA